MMFTQQPLRLRFPFIGSSRDAHYKIPPMDPAKLDYFRTVKEITGKLKFSGASTLSSFVESVDVRLRSSSRVPADPVLARESDLSVRVREPADHQRKNNTRVSQLILIF